MTPFVPNDDYVMQAYVRGMRNAFIAATSELEEEFQAWVKQLRADAWDEGFDAGERDSLEHVTFDEPCITNPHREGTWSKWDSPLFHEGRLWGRMEQRAAGAATFLGEAHE